MTFKQYYHKILAEKYEQVLESGMEDSWTDTIDGKQVTITLSQILEYLKDAPVKDVEIYKQLVSKDPI